MHLPVMTAFVAGMLAMAIAQVVAGRPRAGIHSDNHRFTIDHALHYRLVITDAAHLVRRYRNPDTDGTARIDIAYRGVVTPVVVIGHQIAARNRFPIIYSGAIFHRTRFIAGLPCTHAVTHDCSHACANSSAGDSAVTLADLAAQQAAGNAAD